MKILVGYDGDEAGRLALSLAKDYAKKLNGFVYIVMSMEGGSSEKQSDIIRAEETLELANEMMSESGIEYDAQQSVRGFTPGEDLVQFAEKNKIDHIFLGVRKRSRVQKALLGSTAQHVILKAPCPVTTVRFDSGSIKTDDLLKDRRVLVVDDEPDILETVEEILDMCSLDMAATFEEAAQLIKKNRYDIAILDIMGVSGYQVLEIAKERDIPALMLTAHALSPENLKESIVKGADAYVPKDELVNLPDHVADVLKARIEGKKGQGSWFKNLQPFFDKTFGQGWRNKDKSFWNSFDDKYGR